MPNHVHLLLRIRQASLQLNRIVATVKNEVLRLARSQGVTFKWRPGFHDRILREYDDPGDVARYVTENPVRAGLVTNSLQYDYCGIVDRWF